MKLALAPLTAVVVITGAALAVGLPACTAPQAQVAETIVPIVTSATCQILEDVDPSSPLVTLICNAVDGVTGAAAPQQKVQVARTSDVYVSLKSAGAKP